MASLSDTTFDVDPSEPHESEKLIIWEIDSDQPQPPQAPVAPWRLGPHVLWPDFWAHRYRWPASTSKLVFLGDAVLRLGPVLFPDEWKDTDINARRVNVFDPRGLPYWRVLQVCQWIISRAREGAFTTFVVDADTLKMKHAPDCLWVRPDSQSYFWKCSAQSRDDAAAPGPPPNSIFLDATQFGAAVISHVPRQPTAVPQRRGPSPAILGPKCWKT